jgi:hypothetical protein
MADHPGEATFQDLRARLLRSIEACERGLASLYREHARRRDLAPDEQLRLEWVAAVHLEHARLLRLRRPGGGDPDDPIDTLWVIGPVFERWTLAQAEKRAWETLHDCLGDLDLPTQELLTSRLLPEHLATLEEACARAGIDANAEGGLDAPLD